MSLKKNGGGRVTTPATATKTNTATKQLSRQQDSAPRVWAVAYPPAGQRRHWLLVVQSCPKCPGGGPHAHRGGQNGGLRRAGCGQGRYFVQPRLSVTAQRGAA